MQNLEWYLADLKSMGKNTIETVEKSLTDMFIRLVRIYLCLVQQTSKHCLCDRDIKNLQHNWIINMINEATSI